MPTGATTRAALGALDAAETLQGALPPEYEAKRRLWLAARARLPLSAPAGATYVADQPLQRSTSTASTAPTARCCG